MLIVCSVTEEGNLTLMKRKASYNGSNFSTSNNKVIMTFQKSKVVTSLVLTIKLIKKEAKLCLDSAGKE